MPESNEQITIKPRWESLKNLYNGFGLILRGQVVIIGVDTSLLNQPEVFNNYTQKIDTEGMVEDAVKRYLSNPVD